MNALTIQDAKPFAAVTETVADKSMGSPAIAHIRALDGMRAVAALLVVASHCTGSLRAESSLAPWISNLIDFMAVVGRDCVDIFIMLSGFCLVLPVLKRGGDFSLDFKRFFVKRARRIIPTYYIALLLCCILSWTVLAHKSGGAWDICIPITLSDIVWHLLLLQDAISDDVAYKINYVFWTISVEWHIYFLFPLILLLWRRIGAGLGTISVFIGSIGMWYALYHFAGPSHTLTINYLGLFALGMFAAKLMQDYDQLSSKIYSARNLSYVLGTAALFFTLIPIHHFIRIECDAVIGAWAAVFAWDVTSSRSSFAKRLLSVGMLPFIGTFAYSLYLIHAPFVQIIYQYVVRPLHFHGVTSLIAMIVIGLPVSVGVAFLFSIPFERPFLSQSKTPAKA